MNLIDLVEKELGVDERNENTAVKPSGCTACPAYKTGEGFVPGRGPLETAKIFFVGEGPGEDEPRIHGWPQKLVPGSPFVGGSGRIFGKQLHLVGIERQDVYVTNVVKCRPWAWKDKVGGDKVNRVPTAEEIHHCSQYLKYEVQNAKAANVFVPLGGTALTALTDLRSIDKWRGSVLESGGRKVVGTFHPAFVMRVQDLWPVVIHDLRKVKIESETNTIKRLETKYITHASIKDHGPDLLRRARAAKHVTFDIETYGKTLEEALDPRRSTMVCIGFGVDEGEGLCFPVTPDLYTLADAILGDPDIEVAGQNSENFDIPYTETYSRLNWAKPIEIRGPSFDTMLAFHLTNSSLPKDLGFISSFYTDMPYWKDESKKDLFLYNCKDVDGTTRSRNGLKRELKILDMESLYETIRVAQPVLRSMRRRGIKKDEHKAIQWSNAIRTAIAKKEQVLWNAVGYQINWKSPKQLMELFYDKMGLPVQYVRDAKTKRNRPSCDAKSLEKLSQIVENNPVFSMIIDMRSANQQCSTFIDVEPDENSFVHPRIGCSKAQTGRANSEDPNAQNIPKVLRDIYVPDTSEHVFIEIDWSQIEWRLQVVLSGDRTGLELLTSGLDNHKAVAAEILRKPYERVSKDERYRAKFVVHGLGYGRGARSIALQYGIPLDEVERFIKGFATRFTDFWTWRDTLVESVQRNAYLRNPFGRRRWWFSRQVTEIYNFNAQSTAADMMWVVLAMIDAQLPEGATVRLTVHDSFLICAHRDVAARAAECLKDIMEGTKWDMITDASARPDVVKKFYPEGWFCKADLALGRNWGECSKEGEIQAELFKLYEIGGSPK